MPARSTAEAVNAFIRFFSLRSFFLRNFFFRDIKQLLIENIALIGYLKKMLNGKHQNTIQITALGKRQCKFLTDFLVGDPYGAFSGIKTKCPGLRLRRK